MEKMNNEAKAIPEEITIETFDELKEIIEEMPEGTVVSLDIKVVVNNA